MPDAEPVRVAVLGVGNELMTDDGVGVHVVRWLSEEWDEPRLEWIEAGTAVSEALDLVPAGAHVIVLDAADGGGEPGSVYRFGLDEVEARRGVSLHERSLPEVFMAARVSGASFGRVVVLGIEPAHVEVGTDLSPALQERLPAILDAVRREVAGLLG